MIVFRFRFLILNCGIRIRVLYSLFAYGFGCLDLQDFRCAIPWEEELVLEWELC